MNLRFEWDKEKDKANQRKHGVDFAEAMETFLDPLSITIGDPEHSEEEERYINIGSTKTGRILVVVYTERANRIRIIGVRRATSPELRFYEEG